MLNEYKVTVLVQGERHQFTTYGWTTADAKASALKSARLLLGVNGVVEKIEKPVYKPLA